MRHRRHRASRPIHRLLAVALVLVGAWLSGLVAFAGSIPRKVEDTVSKTDAIVVLTGGSLRLSEGLQLLLFRGQGKKLFVSGVYRGLEVEELLGLSRQAPRRIACCVILGHSAGNTQSNASETAEWMAKEGFTSLRLVTAAYHMPRSLIEFRAAMPDVKIIANPVFPPNVKRDAWWRYPGTALLIVEEYTKYLIAWLRELIAPAAKR